MSSEISRVPRLTFSLTEKIRVTDIWYHLPFLIYTVADCIFIKKDKSYHYFSLAECLSQTILACIIMQHMLWGRRVGILAIIKTD